MPARGFGVRVLRLLSCVVLLASIGCGPPEDVLDDVALRLGPRQFGLSQPRPAMLRLGERTQPVVALSDPAVVGEWMVRTDAATFELPVNLPADLADAPDAAFAVAVQDLPASEEISEHVMRQLAAGPFWFQLGNEWRLDRLPGQSPMLHIARKNPPPQMAHNFHLLVRKPSPARLVSQAFDVPARARLRLGVGMGVRSSNAPVLTASAELACDGQDGRRVFESPLTLTGDWLERDIPVPAAKACVLTLDLTGGVPWGAAWVVPQVRVTRPRAPVQPPHVEPPSGVLMISLDTLGAHHMSGYGYPRATTPRIDAELIARGTTFNDASCTFPMTDVSHMSLFTGLYPGAQPQPGRLAAADTALTLAEMLQRAGFSTQAFTEDGLLAGALGFSTGFDGFTEHHILDPTRGWRTFGDAATFLRTVGDDRFFLFVHTYKAHDPYLPSPGYEGLWRDPDAWRDGGIAPRVRETQRPFYDAYDRLIREADDLVGGLLEVLAETKLDQRTLVVLLADHGEAFGEHVVVGHGLSPHQEALHVPLVLRGPGVAAGRRVATPVSLVDVMPTVFDVLGLPAPAQGQGRSLKAALGPDVVPLPLRTIYFSWLRADGVGMRDDFRKVVGTTGTMTGYDLRADPLENSPVPLGNSANWSGRLTFHLNENATLRARYAAPDRAPGAVDANTEGALRALGYVE